MGDYFLLFTEQGKDISVLEYVTKRFRERRLGLECFTNEGIITVNLPQIELEFEAHLKCIRDGRKFDVFSREEFASVNDDNFFQPCERALYTYEILRAIEVDDEYSAILTTMNKTRSPKKKLPLPSRDASGTGGGASLLLALQRARLLESCQPLHGAGRGAAFSPWRWPWAPPITQIRWYYGEEVALYFAWMSHFTAWLLPPALGGVTYFTLTQLLGLSVDTNKWTPLFSFSMVVWATVFNKSWARRSSEWALEWDALQDNQGVQQVRPSFRGTVGVSAVTGQPELQYPTWRRAVKYLASTVVTTVLLLVAFVVMIASLNFQGYIQSGYFHVEALAQFSAPGAPFDPVSGSFLLCLIPTICHVITIQILNQIIYRNVAKALTEWENHRTEANFENSLILKRFLFEAFDCYISLFYLAFYELDIMKVRKELVSLYTADCLRRLATEALLPWATLQWTRWRDRRALQRDKRELGERPTQPQAVEDARLVEYEQFDDYLEMVIEFGYITMFASAFPLAAALSLVYNLVEMRSDAFKLTHTCRRPRPLRVSTIGTWATVLRAQAVVAVVTNLLLFAFASDQLQMWAPQWFSESTLGGMAEGSGRLVVGAVVVLEHLLLGAALLILTLVPDVPKSVQTTLQRRAYEAEQAYLKLKQEKRLQLSSKWRQGTL